MSIEALRWAVHAPIERTATKMVLIALADCHRWKGGLSFPTHETISKIAPVDRKTLMTALKWLKENGYIADSGQRMGMSRRIIAWKLNIPEDMHPKIKRGAQPETEGEMGPEIGGKTGSGSVQKPHTEPSLNLPSESMTPQVVDAPRAPPAKPKRAKARRPLPDGFKPNEASQEFRKRTMAHWPLGDIRREFDKFKEHHTANATLYADWDAAWRMWLINAEKFRLERQQRNAAFTRNREWIDNPLARQ